MQLDEVDAGDAAGAVAGDAAEGDAAADVGAGPGRRRVGQRHGEVQDDARVRGHGRRRGGGGGGEAGDGEEEQEGEEKSRPPHGGFDVQGAQMRRIVAEDFDFLPGPGRCIFGVSGRVVVLFPPLSHLFLSLYSFSLLDESRFVSFVCFGCLRRASEGLWAGAGRGGWVAPLLSLSMNTSMYYETPLFSFSRRKILPVSYILLASKTNCNSNFLRNSNVFKFG